MGRQESRNGRVLSALSQGGANSGAQRKPKTYLSIIRHGYGKRLLILSKTRRKTVKKRRRAKENALLYGKRGEGRSGGH